MQKMLIKQPQLIEINGKIRFGADIHKHGKTKFLWYSVDRQFQQYIEPLRSDSFLMALFVEAMHQQLDIEIEGVVSEKLLYNLQHYFMKIVLQTFPDSKPINIIAKQVSSEQIIKKAMGGVKSGTATGFSGGVDSFSVVLDHYQNDAFPAYNLSYLVLNNVGSKMTPETFKRQRKVATELSIPLIRIDSNIDEHLSTNFTTEHQLRNISAVMVLQGLITKYYYASSISYSDSLILADEDGLTNSEPFNIHLLSTESLETTPSGSQYSRVEKTALIANNTIVQNYLDVCVNPQGDKNCSICAKCMRTQFTLELLGKLEAFDKVFYHAKYQKLLPYYLMQVLSEEGSLFQEILLLMKDKNYVVSFKTVLAAKVWGMLTSKIKHKIKLIAHKFSWKGYQ